VYFVVMACAFLFAVLAKFANVFSQSCLVSSFSGGGGMLVDVCCCVACSIGCVLQLSMLLAV